MTCADGGSKVVKGSRVVVADECHFADGSGVNEGGLDGEVCNVPGSGFNITVGEVV